MGNSKVVWEGVPARGLPIPIDASISAISQVRCLFRFHRTTRPVMRPLAFRLCSASRRNEGSSSGRERRRIHLRHSNHVPCR